MVINNKNKSVIDSIHLIRKVLTIVLFFSVCFYTAIRVAKWENENIQLFFTNCYGFFDVVKIVVAISILLLEAFCLFYDFINKNENSVKNIFVYLLYLAVCTGFKLFTFYDRFIYFTIVIYFSRYVAFKSIIKTYVTIYTVSLIVLIIGNISGNLSLITNGRGYSFGMIHSNSAGLFLFMYYMAISYLVNDKKIVTIIGLTIELLLIFIIKSRTPFILILLFIALLWCEDIYNKLKQSFRNFINILFSFMPFLLLCFSVAMGLLISEEIVTIDANAGVRFTEIVNFIKENGISLYYCELEEIETLYYLDNGYGHLLFQYGLVAYSIVTIGQILSNIAIVRNNDYQAAAIVICLYIYNLMEFILHFNDLPLLMIAYISRLLIREQAIKN